MRGLTQGDLGGLRFGGICLSTITTERTLDNCSTCFRGLGKCLNFNEPDKWQGSLEIPGNERPISSWPTKKKKGGGPEINAFWGPEIILSILWNSGDQSADCL